MTLAQRPANPSLDLFEGLGGGTREPESLAPGALLLRGLAQPSAADLIATVDAVTAAAPFRNMRTRGGFRMSIQITNCGALGWVSDEKGYRYCALDPEGARPWPAMPSAFERLAGDAAQQAGFAGFRPDACLINRYTAGTRLSLHQDRDEADFAQPIVSVSLGLPAIFLFGGLRRAVRAMRVPLFHGDVVVWGGPARLRYHGVLPLRDGHHPLLGSSRINLTFRKAG